MKKRFFGYFKRGLKTSYQTLFKGKGNLIRYILLLLVDLFGIPLFIFKPFTRMAVQNASRTSINGELLSLSLCFKDSDKKNKYWNYIVVFVVKILVLLALLVVCAAVTAILYFLGLLIMDLIGAQGLLLYLFPAPGLLLTLCVLLTYIFRTLPTSYQFTKTDNVEPSKMLLESYTFMKKKGKWKRFLNLFFHLIFALLGVALVGAIIFGVYMLYEYQIIWEYKYFLAIVEAVGIIGGTLVLCYILIPMYLSYMNTKMLLFDDLTSPESSKDILKVKNARRRPKSKSMEDLFDSVHLYNESDVDSLMRTEDVSTPKSKKELKEIAKLKKQKAKQKAKEDKLKKKEAKKAPKVKEEKVKKEKPVKEPKAKKEKVEKAPVEDVKPEVDFPSNIENIEEMAKTEEIPTQEEVVVDTPVVEETPVVEPEPVVEEALVEEPQVEETPVEEPVVEEPQAEESQIESEPVVEEPVVEEVQPEPVVEEPQAEETPVEEVQPEPVEEPQAEETIEDAPKPKRGRPKKNQDKEGE